MKADLGLFRTALEGFLRPILADPRFAESATTNAIRLLARNFGGQTIPSLETMNLEESEARAAELLPLGVVTAAQRQGVHRSTVYRRAQRHRARKAA